MRLSEMHDVELMELRDKITDALKMVLPDDMTVLLELFGPEDFPLHWAYHNATPDKTDPGIMGYCDGVVEGAEEDV